jgi:hypothetical protein
MEKEKRVSFPVSEREHQALKILAAKEKLSIKALVFAMLEKFFPGWQDVNKQ